MKNLFGLFVALLFSLNLSAQHTKVALDPSPDGGLGVRIIEYTDNNGNQVIGKLATNTITREIDCDCEYLVKIQGKNSYSETSVFYAEDNSTWSSVADGKYTIVFLNRDTNQILYTLIAKLHNGKLKVIREF